MKMNFCTACGNPRAEDHKFCVYCGTRFQTDPSTEGRSGRNEESSNYITAAAEDFRRADIVEFPLPESENVLDLAGLAPGLYRISGGTWDLWDEKGEFHGEGFAHDLGWGLIRIQEARTLKVVLPDSQRSLRLLPIHACPAIHVIERQLVNGRYRVGVDIRPGRYRIDDRATSNGEFVYRTFNDKFECLEDEFGHDAELTIDADLFAFEFSGTLREVPTK